MLKASCLGAEPKAAVAYGLCHCEAWGPARDIPSLRYRKLRPLL